MSFGQYVRGSLSFLACVALLGVSTIHAQSTSAPIVKTNDATAVTASSVELHSTVTPAGRATTAWFEWGTATPFAGKTDAKTVGDGTSAVAFTQSLTGLQPKTNYYFQAVARNADGTTVRGEPKAFTTLAATTTTTPPPTNTPSTPAVVTTDANSVTATTAILHGGFSPNGNVTTAWFDWGTATPLSNHSDPQRFTATTGTIPLSQALANLQPNTTYYFQAVVQTSGGTVVKGEGHSFTTSRSTTSTSTTGSTTNPSVATTDSRSVTASTAILTGTVNPNGKATNAWFDWGTTTSLANHTESRSVGVGTTAVALTASLSGLLPHTTYYFQAVAQVGEGTIVRGEPRSFITSASTTEGGAPSVATGETSALTSVSVELHGYVNPTGLVTTTWFEWGTTTPLPHETTAQEAGHGTTSAPFAQSLFGLQANTTYYYRAVAKNERGTTRGEVRNFTTSRVASTTPQPIDEVEHGAIKSGYVIITPDASSAAPMATLTFATIGNGNVSAQAGLVPTPMTTDATMFVEIVPSISRNIGVALTNPGSTTNTVTLTLRDEDGMVVGTPATVAVPARQQVSRFVNELFSGDDIGDGFVGSLRMQSSSAFAVLGLRFSGMVFSALPVVGTATVAGVPTQTLIAGTAANSPTPGTVGGSSAIVLPQFAMSGGWSTHIALVNNTNALVSGRIDVFDTTGKPLAVKLNGETQSTFTYTIPAGGTFVVAPRDANGQSPM